MKAILKAIRVRPAALAAGLIIAGLLLIGLTASKSSAAWRTESTSSSVVLKLSRPDQPLGGKQAAPLALPEDAAWLATGLLTDIPDLFVNLPVIIK